MHSGSRETLLDIPGDHSLDMIGVDRDSYPLFKLRDSFMDGSVKDSYSISSLSYRTLLKLSAARDFIVRTGQRADHAPTLCCLTIHAHVLTCTDHT